MISLPRYKQETDYTCGAACMRILLEGQGVILPEKTLAKEALASKESGIDAVMLPRVLKKHGFPSRLTRRMSERELQKLLSKEIPVIVNYVMPKERVGHYSIAVGATKTAIEILDTDLGTIISMPWTVFKKLWYGHRSPIKNRGRAVIPTAWQEAKKV